MICYICYTCDERSKYSPFCAINVLKSERNLLSVSIILPDNAPSCHKDWQTTSILFLFKILGTIVYQIWIKMPISILPRKMTEKSAVEVDLKKGVWVAVAVKHPIYCHAQRAGLAEPQSVRDLLSQTPFPPRACIGGVASTRFPGLVLLG